MYMWAQVNSNAQHLLIILNTPIAVFQVPKAFDPIWLYNWKT